MSIFTDMGAVIEEAEYLADVEQCSQAIVREGDHMTVLPYAEARGREMPIIRQVELCENDKTYTEAARDAGIRHHALRGWAIRNVPNLSPEAAAEAYLSDGPCTADKLRDRGLRTTAIAEYRYRNRESRLTDDEIIEHLCSRKRGKK